jgi:hypothetical protein
LSEKQIAFGTAAQLLPGAGSDSVTRWLPFNDLANHQSDAERKRGECSAQQRQLAEVQKGQQTAAASLAGAQNERDRVLRAPFAPVDLIRLRAEDQLLRMNESHAAEIESIIGSAALD